MCARVLAIASLVAISTGAARSGTPNVVTVVATEFAFDMPLSIPAGSKGRSVDEI